MMAAITAARGGARVVLYERNDRLGRKLLSTGNGKCNLGNEALGAEDYHGGDRRRIASWLERFGTEETKAFFASLGLMLKDRDGYLYPVCEQAAVVLDVLRLAVEENDVLVVPNVKVTRVQKCRDGRIMVVWQDGSAVYDSVVLACGGKAAPKTGSDGNGYLLAEQLGLAQSPVVPALVGLRCREEACKAIAGVRAEAEVRILEGTRCLLRERGELQLVEYGISGIPVFQLSGQVNYLLREKRVLRAEIDFLPQWSQKEFEAYVRLRLRLAGLDGAGDPGNHGRMAGRLSVERGRTIGRKANGLAAEDMSGRTVETFFTGLLHKKLMTLFIKMAGLKTNILVGEAGRERLLEVFRLCKAFSLQVVGSNSFDQAQVCAGGVKLSEVTEQLEAVKAPGVYLAGELLDVDGRCGGYNLHWAWCSGYIAGPRPRAVR